MKGLPADKLAAIFYYPEANYHTDDKKILACEYLTSLEAPDILRLTSPDHLKLLGNLSTEAFDNLKTKGYKETANQFTGKEEHLFNILIAHPDAREVFFLHKEEALDPSKRKALLDTMMTSDRNLLFLCANAGRLDENEAQQLESALDRNFLITTKKHKAPYVEALINSMAVDRHNNGNPPQEPLTRFVEKHLHCADPFMQEIYNALKHPSPQKSELSEGGTRPEPRPGTPATFSQRLSAKNAQHSLNPQSPRSL